MATGWLSKAITGRAIISKPISAVTAVLAKCQRAACRRSATAAVSAGALVVISLMTVALPVQAQNVQIDGLSPEVGAFVMRMTREHGFDAIELGRLFSQLQPNDKIIRAFTSVWARMNR